MTWKGAGERKEVEDDSAEEKWEEVEDEDEREAEEDKDELD